jgi:uridine phosphorylase
MIQGITATTPGFYGSQGRILRTNLSYHNFNHKIETVRFGDEKIINFEMETSALYGLGRSLDHNVLTVCAVIANRVTEEFSADHHKPIGRLIKLLLVRLSL